MQNNFSDTFMRKFINTIENIDTKLLEDVAEDLLLIKNRNRRIFFIGLGGSASMCGHAVNDFRKIAGMKALCLTDNISELTARANDEGWNNAYTSWLEAEKFELEDCLFVLSVGGGNIEKNVSLPLVNAIRYAENIFEGIDPVIISITGRNDGYVADTTGLNISIPNTEDEFMTPFAEALQSVIIHLLVSHPLLKENKTKWEEVA